MRKYLLIAISALLLASGCSPASNVTTTVNTQSPTPSITKRVYDNQYMRFEYPAEWTAAEGYQSPNIVNITKDNYILFINADVTQASGVEGGRFAEIAQGSPSADTVVIEQPSPPCGTLEKHEATSAFTRNDLFIKSADSRENCSSPKNGKNVWYFSYINTQEGGYINYYKNSFNRGYVITMSYNSPNVDTFPAKDSPELTAALLEMTDMVKALTLKKQ
jgi:hypothetical protein